MLSLACNAMKKLFPHSLIALVFALQLSCATVQRTINSPEAAQTPLACAHYAAQISDNPEMIAQVALKYAEAGDFRRAIEIVESISERGFIEVLRREFYFRRVLDYNVSAKIKALVEITILQAKAEKKGEALKTLERALFLASLLKEKSDWDRGSNLKLVIPNFVLIGYEERAFFLANSLQIVHPDSDIYPLRVKLNIFTSIAENLAKTGNSQRSLQTLLHAEEMLERIPTAELFGDEGINIADVYAQLGKAEKAISLIGAIAIRNRELAEKNPNSVPSGLELCAKKLVELGQVQEGINLAESIVALQTKAYTLSDIAQYLVKSKGYEFTLSLLDKIPAGEMIYRYRAQTEIAKQLLDEGSFDKAFGIAERIDNKNYKAVILAYAAQKYAARGNQAKARAAAISAYESGSQVPHDTGFTESAVQYMLLVDKNVVLEKLKDEGFKEESGWLLTSIAEKLGEASQDQLAIEVLKYIQTEGQIIHADPITIQDYRAEAIVKMAIRYYDSKRPVNTELQATLAKLVKLLD
jgi:tetratricopeptide (TPR) repeat protein